MRSNRTQSWIWMALVAIYVGGYYARVLPAQQVGHAPLEVLALEPPAVARALGRLHLVYELHLTNFGREAIALDGLDVLGDEAARIATLTGSQLSQRLVLLSGEAQPAGRPLPPGGRAVVYLWLTLPPDQRTPPHALVHIVRTISADGAAATVVTPPVAVRTTATSLAPPLEGGPWVAARGPSNASPHRLSLVTMNGRVTVPQRFAVDWVRLGDDGLVFRGNGARVEDWYGYDAPVRAAADGTVTLVRDGEADRRPLDVSAPSIIDAAEAPGNVVVVDIGNGLFASYAHLKARSLRVARGDRVSAGQILAHVGNSGNSQGPHLHFQIATAVEPLAGEGQPFVLDAFRLEGRVNSVPLLLAGTPWHATATQPAREVTGELPLENMVVRFPPARIP